jgi:hypothetical protein
VQFHFQPRVVVQQLDPCIVKLGNRFDQAEPQAATRPLTAAFKSIEPLDDIFLLIPGNTGASVGDYQDWPTRRRSLDFYSDGASAATVLYGVIKEIG